MDNISKTICTYHNGLVVDAFERTRKSVESLNSANGFFFSE
jgi:hypothetical protein